VRLAAANGDALGCEYATTGDFSNSSAPGVCVDDELIETDDFSGVDFVDIDFGEWRGDFDVSAIRAITRACFPTCSRQLRNSTFLVLSYSAI